MRKLMMLFLGFVVLLLTGCGTKYVVVPEYHVRDSVVLRWQRDSVYLRDSVYVSLLSHGDTVYVTKCVTKYAYKDRVRTDTVIVERRDSVPCIVERTQTEWKWRTRWYDKVCRRFTVAVLLCGVGGVAAWLVRKRVKG